ncbi:hypothetical protein [Sphingobacterium hungaricum]
MKALKNFKKFSDVKIGPFASVVLEKMGSTTVFDDYKAHYDLLNPALTAFNAAYSLSKGGTREQIEDKRSKKKALIDVLEMLCDDVNFVAKGRKEILLLSGFHFNQDGSDSSVKLTPIERLQINYTKNLGVFGISYKFQRSVASGLVVFSMENKSLDPALPYFSKPINKSKEQVDLGIRSGVVSIKLILYGKLGDTVESVTYEIPISKIGI